MHVSHLRVYLLLEESENLLRFIAYSAFCMFICFFEPHLAVLRPYFWLCFQGLPELPVFLSWYCSKNYMQCSENYVQCQGSNQSWSHERQMLSLCIISLAPNIYFWVHTLKCSGLTPSSLHRTHP